ncbi:hypothetical protein CF327_g5885 [Tilletia walkeri]|uniref:Uncharacterized protein n=1 Tax=Tilletia walkeri TaxID=117179 RepID=A0A8X7T472_9BASI|nr:hypothetical protein CF327_g5885 [Tilletia walkeri]KAE8267508.1 hypothetical protein A4X09_0g4837 [Tilletia walkeri]
MKPAHLKLFASEHNVLEPLPANIPVAKILQDFLRFMVQSTKDFIADRVPDGGHLVANLANRTEYILTIPNGWEVEQQEMIRKCCIAAGLVTQERAKRYIHFLHEAEASINYCAAKMSEADWINEIGKRVLIVDAGGGTVDITSYRVQETEPKLMVKETSASECLLVGSATIDRQFRKYLERRLSGSKLDNSDDLAHYQRDFSTGIKTQFAGVDRDYLLKCGPATLESSSLGIERGRLKLKGTDISSMFEHSVVKTVAAVMNQVSRDSANEVTVAAMVGGFSESEYFRTEVRKRLGTAVKVCKPDGATAKAVAHGAVAWFLDGCVTSRIAKYDYGVRCSVRYDPSLETHRAKESDCQALASSGHKMLTHAFGTILKRGQESSDDETISEKYQVSWSTEESLVKNVVIYAYRGEDEHAPEFLSEGPFDHLVTFSIDLEPFRSMLPVATGPTGAKYIRLPLHLAMRLNGTQVAATAGFEVGGKRYTKEAVLILDKLSS